jgi:hypothetical protein
MTSLRLVALSAVVAALLLVLPSRALAESSVSVRSSTGATCTGHYIFLESEKTPLVIFTYEGTGGPATVLFRFAAYGVYPAVYAERLILGTGTAAILNPFGGLPAAVFSPLTEFYVSEAGLLESTGYMSLLAVGADVRQVLRTAVSEFCEGFSMEAGSPTTATAQ